MAVIERLPVQRRGVTELRVGVHGIRNSEFHTSFKIETIVVLVYGTSIIYQVLLFEGGATGAYRGNWQLSMLQHPTPYFFGGSSPAMVGSLTNTCNNVSFFRYFPKFVVQFGIGRFFVLLSDSIIANDELVLSNVRGTVVTHVTSDHADASHFRMRFI
jgi:hypothetical protein